MWGNQVTGMRMAPKPASRIMVIRAERVRGCPHMVSDLTMSGQALAPSWASSVLPRFQPTFMWTMASVAVSKEPDWAWAATAMMAAASSRKNLLMVTGRFCSDGTNI